MKNKTIITVISIVIIISVLVMLLLGCDKSLNISDLSNKSQLYEYNSTVRQLNTLSGWQYETSGSNFVVLNKYDAENVLSSKMLYSLLSDKSLLTLTENFEEYEISFEANYLAIVKNTVANRIDVYDANGIVFSADNVNYTTQSEGGIYEMFFSNGKCITVSAEDGTVKVGDTSFFAQPDSSYYEKLGDYYIGNEGLSYCLYDKNFKKISSVNISDYLYSNSMPISFAILKDYTFVMQTIELLDKKATSYDLKMGEEKYNIHNHVYDMLKGKTKKLELGNVIFETASFDDRFNYNLLTYTEITSDKELGAEKLGIFNNDMELLADLSGYLPSLDSADNIEVLANGDLRLSDDYTTVIVGGDGTVKNVFDESSLTAIPGTELYMLDSTNMIYDAYGQFLMELPKEASLVSSFSPSDYIYYLAPEVTTDEGGIEQTTEYYYSFNIDTKTTVKIGEKSEVNFKSTSYTVSKTDSEGKTTTSCYLILDGKEVYKDIASDVSVREFNVSVDSGAFLVQLTDAEGNTVFYLYTITYDKKA